MSSAPQVSSRTENRDSQFSGEFSCALIPMENSEIEIPIRPLDVSPRGLGFFSRKEITGGKYFFLRIGNSPNLLRVELAYCASYLGIDNLYRCGLFLREEDGDLRNQCLKAGILESS